MVNILLYDEELDCIYWLDGVNIFFIWLKKYWKFDLMKGCVFIVKCLL